jgi:hypothetical protein
VLLRYVAAPMVILSGSGLIVTVVESGDEVAPPEFLAVMLRLTTEGVTWPCGSVGAVKKTVAVFALVVPTLILSRAGEPLWVTVNVSASPAGSVPLIGKLELAPEATVTGAVWFMVGAEVGFTVTVVLVVAAPPQLLTVSCRVTTVWVETVGAVKVALCALLGVSVPCAGAVHAYVRGAVPVALADTVMLLPAATV